MMASMAGGEMDEFEPCTFDPTPEQLWEDNKRLRAKVERLQQFEYENVSLANGISDLQEALRRMGEALAFAKGGNEEMSLRRLGQDEGLACQALWVGDVPQHAHVCLACPQCHERPVGVAISVGAYCYRCGWREGGGVRLNDGD